MESKQQVVRLMSHNGYFTSIGLTDDFLHLLIHKNYRRFLRFHWDGQTFQFRTAPFGLFVVPWLFTNLTKRTKSILLWARTQGIFLSAYIDDRILMVVTKAKALSQTNLLLSKLHSLGWQANSKKSQIQPTQTLTHLGFQLESQSMTIRLPGPKSQDLGRSIQAAIMEPIQTCRTIHSLTMWIKSSAMAIFPAQCVYASTNLHQESIGQMIAIFGTGRSLFRTIAFRIYNG